MHENRLSLMSFLYPTLQWAQVILKYTFFAHISNVAILANAVEAIVANNDSSTLAADSAVIIVTIRYRSGISSLDVQK